jgi:cytochrome c peroxidase
MVRTSWFPISSSLLGLLLTALACSPAGGGKDKGEPAGAETAKDKAAEAPKGPDSEALREQAKALFGSLPGEVPNEANPVTDEKVALGRMLYHDARLSKNHDVSCQSCHQLEAFGVDGAPTSTGHKGQKGSRNAPTVYNAALHTAQFWDGRAADVEEQAKGPVLNPIEMAMADEKAVLDVLGSIPGYAEPFEKAFPGEGITYDNMGKAIGAFERRLTTPAPIDAFMAGGEDALSEKALHGLELFVSAGCGTCHNGPAIGGGMYQKLGLLKAYETADEGRFEVTKKETDRKVFKVPSLRNIEKTGPYLHDGSIASLEEMVGVMVEYQTQKGSFTPEETKAMLAFLASLTGEVPPDIAAAPKLPESGPKTPAPDPS